METERCENCNREIPSVNFVMHIAHCHRNVDVCTQCGEPVAKAHWQQHQDDYHKTVKCELCGDDIIKAGLENHIENSCLKRIVECIFCGLQLCFSKLNDHEVYCGTRTEACDRCKKYVMVRDQEKHVCDDSQCSDVPSANEDVVRTVPCEFCNIQVSIDELMRHQSICLVSSIGDEDDVEMIDNFNNSSFQNEGKHSHIQEKCTENLPTAFEEVTDGCHGEDKEQDDVIYALPCEICGELCPSDKLLKHQEECLSSSEEQQARSSSPNDHIYDDDDDDDVGLDNLHLHDGPRVTIGNNTEPFPDQDAFLLAYFHPFFSGSVHQGFNQRHVFER